MKKITPLLFVIAFIIATNCNAQNLKIIGPTCLKPNTKYTYYIEKSANDNNNTIKFDSYYWSGLPYTIYPPVSTSSFNSSADFSSITFTTGVVVIPFTLQCCFGLENDNLNGGKSSVNGNGFNKNCISLKIEAATVSPLHYTAPPTCLSTNQTSFSIVYPKPRAGQIYTWYAIDSDWEINTKNNNVSTTTFSGKGIPPHKIKLSIKNNYDFEDFIYQIDTNCISKKTPTSN